MKTGTCVTGFRDLVVQARIGVYEEELSITQPVLISLEMRYSSKDAAAFCVTDDLAFALDYQAAADLVSGIVSRQHFGLLEHLCSVLAEKILADFPQAMSLRLEVKKPRAVPGSGGSFCILEAEPGLV